MLRNIKIKNSVLYAFIGVGIALNPIPAISAPITFNFSGAIYDVSPSVSSVFALGQTIYGSYTFESTSAGESFSPGGILDPSITYYPSALTKFDINFGSYSSSIGSTNRIFVVDDSSIGLSNGIPNMDRYLVETFFTSGTQVAGLSPYGLFLSFQDNTGTLLNTGTLPLTPDIVNQFLPASGALDFVDGRANNRVTFSIGSVNPVSVPEPDLSLMMLIGISSFVAAYLFRKRNYTM